MMTAAERRITPQDILPYKTYAESRADRRRALLPAKKTRRLEVGPFATFHFENYETMWLQVQEMLHIEKGGDDQLGGELEAYNPLIPQGHELIATLLLEIEDAVQRDKILRTLGGIEETIAISLDGETIKGAPTEYEDRTTPDGKTSSVHWIRFRFTPEQVAKFKSDAGKAVLEITHPNYGHMAVIPSATREELAKDFA
ncbi:MAG TPA: DUF3501 family protein [Rhizomicrobium sp.]|jgi:hypothetical protein